MVTRNDTRTADWGVVPVRLVVGLVFLVHGAQKLFAFGPGGTAAFLGQLGIPFPSVTATALIAVEFLGGLALLIGLFTRWVAAMLAIDMLVAILTVHAKGGFFVPDGVEFVLTLFGANMSLVLLGSGAASVDGVIERRSA